MRSSPKPRTQVFGNLVKVLPGGAAQAALEHVDFYVAALRALAGRKPVQTLFSADDSDALGMVRAAHRCERVSGMRCVAAAPCGTVPEFSAQLQIGAWAFVPVARASLGMCCYNWRC
jgi:hypothetical protein